MFEAIGNALLLPFQLVWSLVVMLVQLIAILIWLVVAVFVLLGFYYAGVLGAVLAIDALVLLLAIGLVAYGERLGFAAALCLLSVAAFYTFLFI